MTYKLLRSTDGSNADDGSTWALAKATLVGAVSASSAGGDIFASSVHAETGTFGSPSSVGTLAAPLKVTSVNDSADPPTTYQAGAAITATGSGISFSMGSYYMRGFTLTSDYDLALAPASSHCSTLEDCSLILANLGASYTIQPTGLPGSSPSTAVWKNVGVKFTYYSQSIRVCDNLEWRGGSILAGSTTPTNAAYAGNAVFSQYHTSATSRMNLSVTGVDFSNLASTVNLIGLNSKGGRAVIRDCKMPSGWSGNLITPAGNLSPAFRAEAYNLDAGATNYRLWIEAFGGTIRDETTLVRSGGATDGDTPLAWKLTTNSSAHGNGAQLVTGEIARRYPVTLVEVGAWSAGASKTVTCEFLHDSATNLTNADIWLEAEYLGSSSSPLASIASNRAASTLATPADHAASSVTWTTTGMSNPNKQKLVLTVTPQLKGAVVFRVCLAKASKTVYVDPKITIS